MITMLLSWRFYCFCMGIAIDSALLASFLLFNACAVSHMHLVNFGKSNYIASYIDINSTKYAIFCVDKLI